MPYSGVPDNLTAKMDKCVAKVMKTGKKKSEAVAICKAQIVPKKKKEKAKKATRDLSFAEREAIVRSDWDVAYGNSSPYPWARYVFDTYLVVLLRARYIKVGYHFEDGVAIFEAPETWVIVEHTFTETVARRFISVPIKAVTVGDEGEETVEAYKCYGILFSDVDNKDLVGTYFNSKTDYKLDWYKSLPWLYHHGFNPYVGATKAGDWVEWGVDEKGVFFLGELDAHHEYHDQIKQLLDEEVVYPSSGAMAYLVKVAKDGWVEQWPIVELSSTPSPAEFRAEPFSSTVIDAVRTLQGGAFMTEDKKPLEDRIPGFKADDKEPEVPAVEAGSVEDAKAPEGDVTPDADAETKTKAVSSDEMQQVIAAIKGLDNAVAQLSKDVAGIQKTVKTLSTNEVEKVKSIVAGGDWYKSLFIASKKGTVVPDDQIPSSTIVTTVPDSGGTPNTFLRAIGATTQ